MSHKLAPKCQREPWRRGRQQTPLVLGWVACLSYAKRTCRGYNALSMTGDVTLKAREGLLAGMLMVQISSGAPWFRTIRCVTHYMTHSQGRLTSSPRILLRVIVLIQRCSE